MEIKLYNNQRKFYINKSHFKKLIEFLLKNKLGKIFNTQCDLYVEFVSPEKIKKLNLKLFNKNKLTDVISVPINTEINELKNNVESETIYGEIFICPGVAFMQCRRFNNTFRKELDLLIIHGLLHLIGYQDIENKDIIKMRREENRLLKLLEYMR